VLLAIGADIAMVVFSSSGAWGAAASARPAALLLFLLLLSLEAKMTLVFEWLSLAALRRRIGYPEEVPSVSLSDVGASLRMWIGAVFGGATAPSRWHRARPPA
jgi:hypothetical protein